MQTIKSCKYCCKTYHNQANRIHFNGPWQLRGNSSRGWDSRCYWCINRLTIDVFVNPAVGPRSPQRTVRLSGLPSCGLLHWRSFRRRSGGRGGGGTVARGQGSRVPRRDPGTKRGRGGGGVVWEGSVLLRELLHWRKTAEGVREVNIAYEICDLLDHY